MLSRFVWLSGLVLALHTLQAQMVYPALNFTLLSNIDPEPGNGAKYSGCWGWKQPVTNKEYGIAGSASGTYWVDVTNPASPTVCAYAVGASSNAIWREIKTYNQYCYVITDDIPAGGLQIFDMSALPATVTLVSQNQNLFTNAHAAWIDGNKLYLSSVTYSDNTYSALDVYCLATPTAPVLLRRLQQDFNFINSVHDAFIRNDTVIASCGFQGLYAFKFNNNNTFSQLGSLTSYTASGYNHSSAMTPNGQTLVFMDEYPAGLPVKVASINNLNNIQVLSTINQYQQTTPHNPFVVNNQYVFVSSYQDGTQLYDISNPFAPFVAGYFDTYPQGGGNNNQWVQGNEYNGQWGCYPFFSSRNIFALDRFNGLFMFNTHLFQNPQPNNPPPVTNLCTALPTNLASAEANEPQRIYPNPANDKIVIESDGEGILTLLNTFGENVLDSKLQVGKNEINLASLGKGVYLLKISENQKSITKKIIIQH